MAVTSYVRNGVLVYQDSAGFWQSTPVLPVSGNSTMASDMDTDGNPVPIYKAHSYTYDGSGNLATDTVRDGLSTWVRTYTWTGGAQSTDSGWVKQNG